MHFCIRDPNPTRAEPCLSAGFVFSPVGAPKTQKNPKPERNLKKLKTRKKQKNQKETRKNLKETHLQNPTGTRTRLKTQRVRVPNFTHGFRCQIQPDYIFSRVGFSVDPTRTIGIPSAYLPWKYVSLAACLG
jgi:hypothetical protein